MEDTDLEEYEESALGSQEAGLSGFLQSWQGTHTESSGAPDSYSRESGHPLSDTW